MPALADPTGVNPTASGRKRLALSSVIPMVPAIVTALLHFGAAFNSIKLGLHKSVPTVFASGGMGLTGWLTTYRLLLFKPETTINVARIYALWILVMLFMAVYLALRSGQRLPSGIGSFVAYLLSAMIMVAIATPAIWYVFGSWGPAAVEFVPPVLLTVVTLLMLKSY